ncbi:MHC-like TNF binding protein [Deerpox virus W-848-83]|uniref:MHC-like TNF binding protein n=1 Tax=Deerpox virus (strain Mule deer/United States/W-848-83/1983) TaxID=305674 RepID=Q08FZ2_DPV83|nr:MHC-like TNF binding protein [Deerpox virus W-848-83]ABI99165.1 MHC-like TNF binding protein [Deerpox virus W-848-83]
MKKLILILLSIIAYSEAARYLVYNYTFTRYDKTTGKKEFDVTDTFNNVLIKHYKLNHETGRPEQKHTIPKWFNETKIKHYPKDDYHYSFWLGQLENTLSEINKLEGNKHESISLIVGCTDLIQLYTQFGYVEVDGKILTRFDTKNKRFTKVKSHTFPKVGMLTVTSPFWNDIMKYFGSIVAVTCGITANDYWKLAKGNIPSPVEPKIKVTGKEKGENTTLFCDFDKHNPSSVAAKWYNLEDLAPTYRWSRYFTELIVDTDYNPGEPGFPTNTRIINETALVFASTPSIVVPTDMSNKIVCVGFHSTIQPSIHRCEEGCNGPEPIMQYQGDVKSSIDDEED